MLRELQKAFGRCDVMNISLGLNQTPPALERSKGAPAKLKS